jgi:hypothetical protein
MGFSAHFDIFLHGWLHLFKDAGSSYRWSDRHPQCSGEVPLCCQQKLHTQRFLGFPIGKNPEDSKLVSMEAMQWVLYLSIGDNRRYWKHLAWHG